MPNIWKVLPGRPTRVVGPHRGGVQSENGILPLVEFKESILAYGEHSPSPVSGLRLRIQGREAF